MKISDLIVFLENVLEHRGDIDVYIKNLENDYDDYHNGEELYGCWETTTKIKEISIEKLKGQDILTLTPNNDYFLYDGDYVSIDKEKRRYVLLNKYGDEIGGDSDEVVEEQENEDGGYNIVEHYQCEECGEYYNTKDDICCNKHVVFVGRFCTDRLKYID